MDTRMIDVAIGLVLVFAVASLVVTALQEAWAAVRNTRGENLKLALSSMLGDKSKLVDELLNHPLLVSLSRDQGSKQRMPSYLPSDVVVTALLAMLARYTNGIRPESPSQLILALKSKMPADQQNVRETLESLVHGVEQDWPAYQARLCAWYDAIAERSGGWFKRRTQMSLFLVSFVMAATANINPIRIVDALWHDAAMRKNVVAQADLAMRAYQAESGPGQISGAALPIANDKKASGNQPALASRQTLAVEDAIASLKQDIEAAAASLPKHAGSGNGEAELAALKAVIELRGWLDKERQNGGKALDQQRLRGDAKNAVDRRLAIIREVLANPESAFAGAWALKMARQLDRVEEELKGERQERAKAEEINYMSQDQLEEVLRDCKNRPNAASKELCESMAQLSEFGGSGIPIGWSWANFPVLAQMECSGGHGKPQRNCGRGDAIPFDHSNFKWNLLLAISSWVISAFAMSLGAPFWFDTLGKLIKIRSSGARPDSGTAVAGTQSASASPTSPSGGVLTTGATPPPGPDAEPGASLDAMSTPEKRLTAEQVARIQRKLGLPSGQQNGRIDFVTRGEIAKWQEKNGAPPTGILNEAEIAMLLDVRVLQPEDDYVG